MSGKQTTPTYRFFEPIALAVFAAIYFFLRLFGQRGELINRIWDEGIYFALIKLVAEGKGQLYRDFVTVHPPAVLWAGAKIWNASHGDIVTLRVCTVLFCSLACVPMYLLVRRLYGSRTALLTLLLVTATPGFSTWLGRTVMLDLALHVPLYFALWILLCGSKDRLAYPVAAGLLVGFGEILKETAITAGLAISLGLLFSKYLVARRLSILNGGNEEAIFNNKTQAIAGAELHPFAWQGFTVAFLIAFLTVTLVLARIPNYLNYAFVIKGQSAREIWRIPGELLNGFYMLPLQMTFGIAGAIQMARSTNRSECFLGLFAIINTVVMIVLPSGFYWRYLMPAMPVFSIGAILWWNRNRQVRAPAPVARLQVVSFGLCILVGLVTLTAYFVHDRHSPPEYKTALRILASSHGPVFTLDPIWIVASGQSIHAWRCAADPCFRLPNVPRPQAFTDALRACPTVVLNHVTLQQLPKETGEVVRREYRTIYLYDTSTSRTYLEILVRR